MVKTLCQPSPCCESSKCSPHRAALKHPKGIAVTDAQDIADELIAAEREHKAIGQFSDNYPDFDLDTAYRAQRAFVQSKLDAGERSGRLQAGFDQPEQAAGDGRGRPAVRPGDQRHDLRLTASRCGWIASSTRRVESEIAFLLARDIEPPATVISVLAATDVVFGAVDVLDSRYEGFKFTLTDVVADNASAGGFYLGPVTRRPD